MKSRLSRAVHSGHVRAPHSVNAASGWRVRLLSGIQRENHTPLQLVDLGQLNHEQLVV